MNQVSTVERPRRREYSAEFKAMVRHGTAMSLLQAGVDPCEIALWLGHESPAVRWKCLAGQRAAVVMTWCNQPS